MPGKIKVKVLAGRNLPVMDRASDTTDAFVEIKFGSVTHKTDVCRKSLNPHWSSTEWYRFEVDESELQDEPLQLRLMDHDTYSANDAIGKVVISLAPLLAREANNMKSAGGPSAAVLSGWIPVFDTMHGIRGELNVIVKVELFTDFNKYKTSSCGVQFFHCPTIPPGYKATAIHGFVEELVVNDDPEYQWIDKIRTPRASNEARQVAFIKLSNQVQRLVGLKAAELGANAVVGYQQDFDLEGEAGVVARAIGTAVTLIPPAMPSQSLSIPPCTQQQLRKYLDILATDGESITDLNQYFKNHQDELTRLLNILNPKTPTLLDDPDNIEDDEKSEQELMRESSVRSYTGSLSIYQDDCVSQKSLKHISDDQTDLNKLLKRNDDSDSDTTGTLQKVKKIKTNFFTKRFSSTRSRKCDKQEDQISLQSNSSDTSRISLNDIRNEFKKLKRLRKPKFKKTFTNNEDEGIGMASILARSVIHAHTTLACIAETQDSEHSPSSTIRRISENDPTIISDDEQKTVYKDAAIETKWQDEPKLKVPEIHTSLKNFPSDNSEISLPKRKLSESCPATPMVERSENLLKLPGETGYFESLSLSGDSSEIYTSSEEEDEESSDQNADGEKSIETTSSVVQSVLNKDVNPEFIAQMDRKLSVLEGVSPILKESKSQSVIENIVEQGSILESSKSTPCLNENEYVISNTLESIEPSKTPDKGNVSASYIQNDDQKSNSHRSPYFKFFNPFSHKKDSKSLSAPGSPIEAVHEGFVYRSSKKIKSKFSKLSKSNMFKSLSHYSLIPKKRSQPTKFALSQPGSMTDVPFKVPSHETVLGSPFLSYADLMTLDKELVEPVKIPAHKKNDYPQSKVTMYIGSEPVSRASVSGPSSPYHKDDGYNFDHKIIKRDKTTLKPTGIVHTAVETILIDKVQSLLIPTSPEACQSKEKQFFNDVNERLEKVEEAQNQLRHRFFERHINTESSSGLQENMSMCTINSESDQTITPPRSVSPAISTKYLEDHHDSRGRSKSREQREKHESLISTAMKTILIDKVQSLIPSNSEIIIGEQNESDTISHVEESHHRYHNKKSSLIHTAMETILLDKVQALIPSSTEIVAAPQDDDKEHVTEWKDNKRKSSGILHTAIKTILLDKAQTLIPPASAPVIPHERNVFEDTLQSERKKTPDVKENISLKSRSSSKNSLLGTAIETILMEKVQTLIPTTSEPVLSKESGLQTKASIQNKTVETSLLGKVQTPISISTPLEENNRTHYAGKDIHKKYEESKKHDSIFQSAIQTILVEKVQTLLPSSSETGDLQNESNMREIRVKTGSDPSKDHILISSAAKIMDKKLTRQNSIHSLEEESIESQNMFKEIGANFSISSSNTHSKPVLQHFHPILGGPPLETIPSLPESSLDHTESLDIDGVERTCDCQSDCKCQECDSETNSASVCDNSHAACDVDRNERDKEKCDKERGSPRHARHESYGGREPVVTSSQPSQNASLNSTSMPLGIHRRSSDSDLSVTPKGICQNASAGNTGSVGGAILKPSMNSSNLEMLEYPFLTMTDYPPGFVVHIGGTVCARSVKLVDAGGESAARAAWWAELRTELRAHARALRCNAVIAYTESAAICEDVCVLSASGTAAVINLDCDFGNDFDFPFPRTNGCRSDDHEPEFCGLAHVPYSPGTGPYRAELSTCGVCRKARVPAVLLATCSKPSKLQSYAKAVTVTAVAARIRRAQPTSEPGARDISDQLPFLEYELHKLLLAKLRMQGANALFSLQTQISIGERCVIALASGTAVRLVALPPPTPPRIKALETDRDALEIQRALWDSFTANKAANGYDIGGSADQISNGLIIDPDAEEAPALDLCVDKDACVLELDEAEDIETAKSLAARRMHMQVFTNSLKAAGGLPPFAFAQVWRARLVLSSQCGASAAAERHVARAMDGVTYKLRRLQPCALVAPRFQIELPEDEIQLVVSGTAIPLLDPTKPEHAHVYIQNNNTQLAIEDEHGNSNHIDEGNTVVDDDDIFALDEEQMTKLTPPPPVDLSEDKNLISNGQVPTSVSLTSLSYVSGSRAERRICALRLLFVRETTAVRELGGLSGFLHTFTCEVLAIVRAYTAALGGNALTSFYITQLMLQDNAHKNQGQCLLSVGGDVVHVTY